MTGDILLQYPNIKMNAWKQTNTMRFLAIWDKQRTPLLGTIFVIHRVQNRTETTEKQYGTAELRNDAQKVY